MAKKKKPENCAYFGIKNFEKFQHYSKRNPPWIKLYRSLLDDPEFIDLDEVSRWRYLGLMLVASMTNNVIKNDPSYIQKMLRLDHKPDLTQLFRTGFLLAKSYTSASSGVAKSYQDATPETERETERETETKTEKNILSGKPDHLSQFKSQAEEILEFLNKKTGRSYRAFVGLNGSRKPSQSLEIIMHRLRDGATVADCRGVIARKARKWGNDEKMSEFLRPKTLFNRTNFEQYLGEQEAGA